MGSLTSRPEIPATPQPVFVPMPAPVTSPSPPAPQTPVEDSAAPEQESESGAGDNGETRRSSNLLSRNRGRLSTVLTGFRGLLSEAAAPSGRKTLLGE